MIIEDRRAGFDREAVGRQPYDCVTELYPIDALPDRPRDRERAVNVADTCARMGWRPAMSLDDGLARTVKWHRRYGASPEQAEP